MTSPDHTPFLSPYPIVTRSAEETQAAVASDVGVGMLARLRVDQHGGDEASMQALRSMLRARPHRPHQPHASSRYTRHRH